MHPSHTAQGARLLAAATSGKKSKKPGSTPKQGSYRPPSHTPPGCNQGGGPHPCPRPVSGASPRDTLTKAALQKRRECGAPDSDQDRERPSKRAGGGGGDGGGDAGDPYVYPADDRDQYGHYDSPPANKSTAGNDFLLSMAGRAQRQPAPRALHPQPHHGGRLGGFGHVRAQSAFTGGGKTFPARHSGALVTTGGPGSGMSAGSGRQAAITDYLGGSGSGLGLQMRLPAGMVNHGNTCYLNAVLQVRVGLHCVCGSGGSLGVEQGSAMPCRRFVSPSKNQHARAAPTPPARRRC